ncbi:hypothetical protein SNOUR_40080 [Streptomyces noursei ATCC 11455]|nr:hypothetical protein SNOUR_40080 [Streptomyces noursei ATCC 11455]
MEIGDLRPRFAELEEHLLRHGKVRHWSEWWHQYVEVPLGDSDHDTYRQVMLLIGSLFRRLAPGDPNRVRVDEDRERYMWTRMRAHLAATGADPADCLYVCGAFHAASRVAEFGVHGTDTFEISPRTATTWQHGLIPSSHAAIEAQFGLAAGSVSIAATVWAKNVKRTRVQPYRLNGQTGCDRPQLELAVGQSHPEDPSKTALLWAARTQLGHLSRADLRAKCDALLGNPLVVPAYPRYLSGFLHALEPVPGLTDFVVEAVSIAFGRLLDPVLLPWLPTLIGTLRSDGAELAPLLIREAGRIFPGRLAALDAWTPPWRSQPEAHTAQPTPGADAGHGVPLLAAHPATCDALAGLLGCDGSWQTEPPAPHGAALTRSHPDTAIALEALLAGR